MKHYFKHLIVPLLFILGCSDDEQVSPAPPVEEFFMELKIGTSTYRVSDQTHELAKGNTKLMCSDDGYVNGYQRINLEDASEKSFIRTLTFKLSKKVFTDDLNLQDELSYVRKVVTAKTFGFPINTNGFYEVYDLENDVFEVSKNVSAEADLSLVTADGFYRSTSVVPNTRDGSSFLVIDKVVENKGTMPDTYPYIVEGRFMVDLFKGLYGTTSERVEGKFRWPVGLVQTSELVELCR
jgi:hypothetical protein